MFHVPDKAAIVAITRTCTIATSTPTPTTGIAAGTAQAGDGSHTATTATHEDTTPTTSATSDDSLVRVVGITQPRQSHGYMMGIGWPPCDGSCSTMAAGCVEVFDAGMWCIMARVIFVCLNAMLSLAVVTAPVVSVPQFLVLTGVIVVVIVVAVPMMKRMHTECTSAQACGAVGKTRVAGTARLR